MRDLRCFPVLEKATLLTDDSFSSLPVIVIAATPVQYVLPLKPFLLRRLSLPLGIPRGGCVLFEGALEGFILR